MTYTLFIWTIVVAYGSSAGGSNKVFYDWRPLTVVEETYERRESEVAAKCHNVAKQLNISENKYKCIRTK